MKKIGFTGTKKGVTTVQGTQLLSVLTHLVSEGVSEARHGDCVGADSQFHSIVVGLKVPRVVIHPPTNPEYRYFCKEKNPAPDGVEIISLPEEPYLVRDHRMVDAVNFLIGCPLTLNEVLWSGTWATLRYAQKINREYLIIFPDGSMQSGEWGRWSAR